MSKIGKAKGCVGGLILGSAIRALIFIMSALIKVIASFMVFFGLWAPFFYAILGGILYLVFQFDPFSGSIDSKIYLGGFAGTVLCAILITIKHLFDKPAQSVAEGFKKPIWKKEEENEEESVSSRRVYGRDRRRYEDEDEYEERDHYRSRGDYPRREDRRDDYRSDSRVSDYRNEDYRRRDYRNEDYRREEYEEKEILKERPKIYYSAREKDTLVHEYNDRFEVFRVIDGRTILDKVEYKHL